MRVQWRIPAVAIALALATLSCLAQTSDSRKVRTKLVVWGLTLGPDSKGDEAGIREFEKLNPDIEVRALSMGAGNMNPQKLMTAIVGKVPPDVILQDRFSVSDWASRGAFRALDDLVQRDLGKDEYSIDPKDYYPAAWEEASFEGKVYAIPTGTDDRVLYWNRDVFNEEADNLRKAGLDPTRPPRTWSEILAYSKVLTKKDKNGRLERAGFIPNYGNSWLYMYAFQNNASFISEDGRTCTLASPEATEALQFMVDGYDLIGGYEEAQKFQGTFQGNDNDPFFRGKVAMKIDGDWIPFAIARWVPKLNFGVAPAPVPDDRFYKRGRFANEKDTFITWIGGFACAIPTGAKHVEAGWRFIKYWTSKRGRFTSMRAQNEFEKLRGRQFVARVQAHIKTNDEMFEEFKPGQPNIAEAVQLHIDMMPFSRIRPATFVGQLLWNEHVRAVEQAALKKKSPYEALLAGQKVVQRDMDEYFNREKYPVIDMRIPAFLGLGAVVLGVAWLVWAYKRQRLGAVGRHEAKWAYLFVSPWLVGFLVFTLGPMVASLFFSFTSYNVLSDARWVGTKNYSDFFSYDSINMSKALGNTLYFAGIGVPFGIITGLAVALLLNSAVRGMRYYRTVFYIPAIVPAVASVVLWMWILNPDPTRGILNGFWNATITPWLGVNPPGWLTVEDWAKPALILQGLWGAGSGMVLWLAGLKGVSPTLYEAASIDGATPWQQFWTVTLPQLSSLIFFNLVMGFIGALQQFDGIYVITKGEGAGPGDALLMPVYHLFQNGFTYFKMGYASAIAWLVFVIVLVLTLIQFKLAPRWVHYEVEK